MARVIINFYHDCQCRKLQGNVSTKTKSFPDVRDGAKWEGGWTNAGERERERVKAKTSVSTQQAQMRRRAGMWPPSSGISGAGELGSAALFIWPDLAFATRLQQPVAERIFCPPAEICDKYLP